MIIKGKNIEIDLTDDPLKNIALMAPHLSEADQNKVFGLMCGLITGEHPKKKAG